MNMKIRAGLLLLLTAGAAYTGAGAIRTLKPKELDKLPAQLYAALASESDSAGYYLKSYDGYVAVYSDAKFKSVPEMTDIETSQLRSADRAMLNKGIPVQERSELLMLLEDLGS